jgi:hypothetical protein
MTKAVPEQWKARFDPNRPTPSMDDKHIPSPPIRTTDEYEADKEAGIQRVGRPIDGRDIVG